MFCTGAAPTVPGMPDIASMPARPSATANSTKASQSWPACTRSRTMPGRGDGMRSIPWVRTRTTVPSYGSSPTKRLDPPPRTSQGSPSAHTVRRAWTSSADVVASIMRAGAPPVRSVVSRARRMGVISVIDQASRIRTCALTSTVAPAWVTVRSMRADSSSTAPTLATMPTSAPASGSTTTGRVNRTP